MLEIISVSFLFHSHDLFPHTLLQQLQRVSWLPPVRVKAEMLQKGCGWIDNRYCFAWGSSTSIFINALDSFTLDTMQKGGAIPYTFLASKGNDKYKSCSSLNDTPACLCLHIFT